MEVKDEEKKSENTGSEKKELTVEEKIEKVKIIDALRKAGYTVDDACRAANISKPTYYKWKEELREQLQDENVSSQSQSTPKEIQDTYKLLEQYGFRTPTSQTQPTQQGQQSIDVVDQLIQLKKQLDRARTILGGGEGVSAPADSEELEEIKKAIGYLLKRIDELQRGQVYMGRVRKVKYPDGTEIEYDLMPTDYATVKQANTMYDRVVPEALNELKGMRQDLTVFANRLLGLIETNFSHEIKKAPGFFLNPKKRSKEEKERELEEIEKKLEGKELLSMKIGGDLGEVPSNDVGEGWSRENDGGE
ncbi:MAG: transposase [Candidatus Methanospirareceae archaeon]